VHDELILEVAQAAVDDVAALARSVMEGITRLRVPLRVDVGTGTSWASAKG
jgi:DNA polymerase-1